MSPEEATPALLQLLRELPEHVAVDRLDRLWLFPPRDLGGRESGLVVLSVLGTDDAARRDLLTLRYEAEPGPRGALRVQSTLAEQGSAPAERIPRLIEGVLARLGDGAEDPFAADLRGDPDRWAALLASLGPAVDPPNGE